MPLIKFIKQVLGEFSRDKVGQLCAAFAYVATFSIGPLLIVIISVVGLIYGERAATGSLFTQLSDYVGADTAKTLQNVVAQTHKSGSGPALIAGIVGMLLGAAGLASQLQNAFNVIFKVVPDPKGGIKRTVYVKLKDILLVILGGAVVAVSVIASTIVVGLGKQAHSSLGVPPITLEIINNLTSLAIFIGLLYMVYKVVPDVRIPRRVVFVASTVVALMFVVGKIVLGLVIGNNGTASAYGAAASLVTLLLWIYYSGQILFIGAEGIKVYGENHGITYTPKKFSLRQDSLTVETKGLGAKLASGFRSGYKKAKR